MGGFASAKFRQAWLTETTTPFSSKTQTCASNESIVCWASSCAARISSSICLRSVMSIICAIRQGSPLRSINSPETSIFRFSPDFRRAVNSRSLVDSCFCNCVMNFWRSAGSAHNWSSSVVCPMNSLGEYPYNLVRAVFTWMIFWSLTREIPMATGLFSKIVVKRDSLSCVSCADCLILAKYRSKAAQRKRAVIPT